MSGSEEAVLYEIRGGTAVITLNRPRYRNAQNSAMTYALDLGEKVGAARAYELGMVNRVVPRASLEEVTLEIAGRIAAMPPMALTLAKKAVNFAEDEMGLRATIDHSFGLHQLAHAHSAEISGGSAIMRVTPKSMKASTEATGRDQDS